VEGLEQGSISHVTLVTGTTAYGKDRPDLSFVRKYGVEIVEQQMLVSGCPATWIAYRLPGTGTPGAQCYRLDIMPKNQPILYTFDSFNIGAGSTDTINELMRIKDSICITKVK
jgi:hypothetical protein